MARYLRQHVQVRRRKGARPTKPAILIVCEGGKTEPHYFRAVCISLGLSNVRVIPSHLGSAPVSVFESAMQRYEEDDGYDQVYCVFDRNGHASYREAIQKIEGASKRTRKPIPISAIRSVPCFEYWLLLHYTRTTKEFQNCHDVIQDLLVHIQGYEKGNENTHDVVKVNQDTAIANAEWVSRRQKEAGAENPNTEVHELIKKLQALPK